MSRLGEKLVEEVSEAWLELAREREFLQVLRSEMWALCAAGRGGGVQEEAKG
jgi:hypothetical protein